MSKFSKKNPPHDPYGKEWADNETRWSLLFDSENAAPPPVGIMLKVVKYRIWNAKGYILLETVEE